MENKAIQELNYNSGIAKGLKLYLLKYYTFEIKKVGLITTARSQKHCYD
jgi:hypothetical protein